MAPKTGGLSFDSGEAASGWYWPAYTWKVPVGSETRARHIGCPSVPTFSTSVMTPTTKTRFTFAPRGVTTYDGGRSPVPSVSRFASLYSGRRAARRPRGSCGSLQALEHLPRLRLHVDLEQLRGLDDHHEPVVVRGHVPAGLDRLGHQDVRELVPHDVRRHRLLRGRDAGLERLVQEAFREFAVEDRGEGAGAVVQDRLHAEVGFALDLSMEAAGAFPQDAAALRAAVHQAGAFPEVDQDAADRHVGGAPSLREVLDPHPRADVEPLGRRQEVRLQPSDRRPLVEADLRDAPPRLDVGPFDAQDLVRLQGEVLPRAELRLAGLVREDAGEDGLRRPIDLDLE